MKHTTEICDLLVVGSGAAGLAAAVIAERHGLSVIVCERADVVGGTTALSGGEIWVPLSRQAGGTKKDSAIEALEYLRASVGHDLDERRAVAYLKNATLALAFLEDNSLLKYELLPYVTDYFPELAGSRVGLRTLGVIPFDARLLGRQFANLRRPLATLELLGGMSIAREDPLHFAKVWRSPRSAWHVAKMIFRYVLDRASGQMRGTRITMGNALVGRLVATLRERNVPILLSANVSDLTVQQGRVRGATISCSGAIRTIAARRGVILTSGGFSGSPHMRKRYFDHVARGIEHRSPLPPTNDGSGMDLGGILGAAIDRRPSEPGAWAPFSDVPMPDGSIVPFPHFGDRAKPGIIAVDASGARFANEATNYHDFCRHLLKAAANQTEGRWHLITCHKHLRKYGLGRVPPAPAPIGRYLNNGYLTKALTLRDLASQIGVPADSLSNAIAEYNDGAQFGEDSKFGKGSSLYERMAGDLTHQPNACVAAIAAPPYYAIQFYPGDIGTTVGLHVDENSRAVNESGMVIPGLYAAGAAVSSIFGGTYPAAGIMLGQALTSAYLAVKHIMNSDSDEDTSPGNCGGFPQNN